MNILNSQKYNKKFLGKNKNFVIVPKETNFDIDDQLDLKSLESLVIQSKSKYKNYIHVKYGKNQLLKKIKKNKTVSIIGRGPTQDFSKIKVV